MHWGNATVNGVWQYSYFSPTCSILDEFFSRIPGYQNFNPVVY